jgi:polyhydroxyalkanoate synthesis regulator phasin
MKDLISKAMALGLGLGVTGKEQATKIAAQIEKRLGLTKKDSKAFVADAIRKGEAVKKDLDKEINGMCRNIMATLRPVSRKEFDELKAQLAKKPQKRGKKR